MKRTTLILEEACLRGIRELARKEGRQMSQVVNELLVEGLRRRLEVRQGERPNLPAFDMGQPKVDLADRDALESAMTP